MEDLLPTCGSAAAGIWLIPMTSPVRKIREAAGLTQSEFGGKLGIDQSTVSGLEGADPISAQLISKILDVFPREMVDAQVSVEALIRWNRPPSRRRGAAA